MNHYKIIKITKYICFLLKSFFKIQNGIPGTSLSLTGIYCHSYKNV